jgi:phosphatidylserine decarboxylase
MTSSTRRVLGCRLVAFATVLFIVAFTASVQADAPKEGPAAQALRHLVATHPELKELLVASIDRAHQVNPDPVTNPVQTLEQYYNLIAFTERAQPGRMVAPTSASTLYQRLDQGLSFLFFVSDQPLPQLSGRGYFNSSIQYYPPYNDWLRTFVRSWGKALDAPDSWDAQSLATAQADPVFGVQKGWYEDASHWHTFNEFFARRLKSPAARPIASPGDNSVVASPVDAIPQGSWRIDGSSNLVDPEGAPLKSGTVRSIAQLIGEQSAYKHSFAGGTFTHTFLDVGDYHRYHFPLSGVVREARVIPGSELPGGIISWDAKRKRYAFDPSSVGWQALETRATVIIESPDYGLVALLPIGMSPVSSVNIDPSVKPGAKVHKGDEIGYFLFGGSDFVLVFQSGVRFESIPPNADGKTWPHLLMGEKLGTLTGLPRPRK